MRRLGHRRGGGGLGSRLIAGVLLLLASGAAASVDQGLPQGRGVLLPLQDRVGEPQLARLLESLLAQQLGTHAGLATPEDQRAVLRALRIRNASDEPPERLVELANRLGADWFFLATLHEARQGRLPRRDDSDLRRALRVEGAGDTPQVTLSARIIRKGSSKLWWAGFRAASGRDRERVLGLGEVEYLDELARDVVVELVEAAANPRSERARPRLRGRHRGYTRESNPPRAPALVAVIPMDSVADMSARRSAEVATAALHAALSDFGFEMALPGLVRTIRQQNGSPYPGGASRAEWEALGREASAQWLVTGTVETYRSGSGRDPVPWVAFSVRFLSTTGGQIDWIDGLERTGRETASAFDRGRIYSSGDMTYAIMRSLFYGMRPAPGSVRASFGE